MRAYYFSSTLKLHKDYNSPSAITHFLLTSKTIDHLRETHSVLLKFLSETHHYHRLLRQLLTSVLQFQSDNLNYARNLFDQIPHCKIEFLWTSLIRSHVLRDHFSQSISLYARMHREDVLPSGFTFSSVLNACGRIPAIFEGKQIHSRVIQSGLMGNNFVQTALLDMYAKSGFVSDARDMFNRMDDKDVVAWTAMLCAYTKLGMMVDARHLFDNMGERNSISWTTMVAGYANIGDMKAAKEFYDLMNEKNAVARVSMISSWAAMVSCYAQNGYAAEAIELYNQMRAANVKTNEVAMVGAISACTQLRDINMANELSDHMEEGCCGRTLFVSNALIHMHSKCGNVDLAWREFKRMSTRDVITYTALITALADHGNAEEALDLFSKMQKEGIQPNQITFIGLLNACSFAGLVEEGSTYFELMTQVFGIKPLPEHYSCMVDLLGRAGQLERAYNLIKDNVNGADATIWGALLGACKVHGHVELGEIAARNLFSLEPENTGNYFLLANTYASMDKWDGVEEVRKMINGKGMRKIPGCSWI
ncbi:Pentatricopeptide repeat-containing protein family [Quillaja saponaria]|uniref:Pentatricopeptide repeat-containing protein family n=1 Tax=Quillaja saponaria TaxID=32244 RepID=A0AAD7QBC9_QUISA|nr:Pentatricopeptide repeat-containing protein family [Quillaja saponaria]